MNIIERFFHPVGQGAFYSEHFYTSDGGYKVVYDCGTTPLSAKRKEVIKQEVIEQAFSKEDTIDILFISHLDWDHISLIPTLIESVKEVRNVVLPHVDNDYPILLSLVNFPKALKDIKGKVVQIITSPEEYFNKETKVWRIRSVEEDVPRENMNQDILFLDQDTSSIDPLLSSGKKLSLKGLKFWCYIPFNYYSSKEFREELAKKLCNDKDFQEYFKNTLGVERDISVEEALDVLRDPQKVNDIIKDKSVKTKLKDDIYDQLEGKINPHSLVLYSGPIEQKAYRNHFYHQKVEQAHNQLYHNLTTCSISCSDFLKDDHSLKWRVACIYNGDSNYEEKKLKKWLDGLWNNVGTIQIAHHGSKRSHDFDCPRGTSFLCPISYGTSNTYGHPSSDVLIDLAIKKRFPICITEHIDSKFIQIIFVIFSE
ncbi:MBL fold metallo-hydrolase [Porphyromonas cangingivalis]|uniref:MBL fold metallo-hydrolase n=1 Tax=Porphyromonas cangingivalis TaxID=36874 RepID=UPI00051CDFD0|nr:MBL fold metallo-hydrolase [Porphyromonas cangingivalis]KGL49391.1 hypothetical protein HQ34_04480 [Porphyromonas cangingivalis]